MCKEENTALIFAGRIRSELLNKGTLMSVHVLGLTSYVNFFFQPPIFSMRFTSGDCGGHLLSLFSNHANTAMALWQRELSYWNTNEQYFLHWMDSKFPSVRSM